MDFAAAGLGLQYGTVRLASGDPSWASVGERLAAATRKVLGELVGSVEHIGSTAVPGLIAKPVIDLALGIRPGVEVHQLVEPMAEPGWIYRGDAGDEGGWVFVLEDAPGHRVGHAHGVAYDGDQWLRYLAFRELLRNDVRAREHYSTTKQRLAEQHRDDAVGYTNGKTATVHSLLWDLGLRQN